MRRPAALFAGAVTAASLAALAAGIVAIGAPSGIRERRLDARRIDDLRQIVWAIDQRVRETDALPAALDALRTANQPASLALADPDTGAPYDYAVTGRHAYRLCAVFSQPGPPDAGDPGAGRTPEFWRHGAGRQCFSITVTTPGSG